MFRQKQLMPSYNNVAAVHEIQQTVKLGNENREKLRQRLLNQKEVDYRETMREIIDKYPTVID